jgi:uncharacterized membrane protein YgcG
MNENKTETLKPAEAYLLINGNNSKAKGILKYIIGHLFYKKVLAIETVIRAPHPKDPEQRYDYVVRGENFTDYLLDNYETPFTDLFQQNAEMKMLFGDFVKTGLDKTRSKGTLIKRMIKDSELNKLASFNWIAYFFAGFGINGDGVVAANNISRKVDHAYSLCLENENSAEAKQAVAKLGGLSLLLPNIGEEFIAYIENAVNHELEKIRREKAASWVSGCGGGGGCSSGHDSGCSGCGGGGCSGCGGGCGGCS